MRPDSRTRTQPVVLALVTDIVCVVVFCTAGRPVTVQLGQLQPEVPLVC